MEIAKGRIDSLKRVRRDGKLYDIGFVIRIENGGKASFLEKPGEFKLGDFVQIGPGEHKFKKEIYPKLKKLKRW